MNTKTATSAQAQAKSKKTMLNALASTMITDLSALSGLSAKSATEQESKMIDILEEASEVISGVRQDEYGSPEDSFKKIASLWSTHLDQSITEQDVALMMVLLKVARVPDGKKASRDTMVDIAGYAAIGSTLNWT
jgi:hypothetical protein